MDPFRNAALEVSERILGLMDRRAAGDTFGCFDRAHWNYQLADFPSAWFQNATEFLALLCRLDEAPWRSPRLEEWARGAVEFSLSLTHKDGSVAEAYPNERGYCATAFLLAHLTASLARLGLEPDHRLRRMLSFAAGPRDNVPSNQLAAASLGAWRLGRLTGDEHPLQVARDLLARLRATQGRNGGFWEYGDGDLGYQTVTLSLLAQLDEEGHDLRGSPMVSAALDYVEARVRSDGTFDYAQQSRATQFVYPFGLAYFASNALDALIAGLRAGHALRPSWLDDRYVADLATDHLRTYLLRRGT